MKIKAIFVSAVAVLSCVACGQAEDENAGAETTAATAAESTAKSSTSTKTDTPAASTNVADGSESKSTATKPSAADEAPASTGPSSAPDQHQAPELVVERCQTGRIAEEVGRPAVESTLSFCDGQWARYGAAGTEQVLYAQWDGSKWTELKADGKSTIGTMSDCYLPERIAAFGAPAEIDMMECKPGQYIPE